MAYYDFQEPADNNLFSKVVNAYVPDWLTGNNKKLEISRKALAAKHKLEYNTWPEIRALEDVWSDPLFLNFRLMINYNKPYGLFAPQGNDKNTDNSAISYLYRIKETERAELLIKWIEVFKNFIREHDYMIMSCEGLSEIFNHKQGEIYTEADKISFGIREAIDMRFQSLLTQYRHIWFDEERGVEILPANLRRFDIMVVVYGAGYYNMDLYGVTEKTDMSRDDLSSEITLPTVKKLNDAWKAESNIDKYNFSSTLFYIGDCSIDMENSGKTFFENIVNDQSAEQAKNNLSLNFRFAYVTGSYNNIFGQLDMSRILAIAAATEKTTGGFKGILKAYGKEFLKETKKIGEDYLEELKSKPSKYFNALLGEQSFIGNALSTITDPKYLATMVKNTVDVGISTIENKFIYKNIDSLQKIVKDNFSFRFIDLYNKYLTPGPKANDTKFNPVMDTDLGGTPERTDIRKTAYISDSIPVTQTFEYKKNMGSGNHGVITEETDNIELDDMHASSDVSPNAAKFEVTITPMSEYLESHKSSVLNRKGF